MSTVPAASTATARPRSGALRHMLRHGFVTIVISALIAAALTLGEKSGWARHLVYSLSIGLLSWLFIDAGRLWLTRRSEIGWPSGAAGYLLVGLGVTFGFLGGNLIGDAWSGAPAFGFLTSGGNRLVIAVAITLATAAVLCLFFYSLGRSQHLQDQVDQARRAATEARLKLLETQLEPHMLFNTLANLRVLITLDPPRAVAMLDRLDAYLRTTLAGSRALAHPLSAEFARLDDYLALMSVRMGDRLRHALALPDDLRDVPVPPMLLQPLVENAIRHGLEPRIEGGRIDVRARREAGRLVVEVRDTGVGLDAAAPSDDADGSGFGLAQVRERLAAVHGDQGRLHLASLRGAEGGTGTCATLSFPLPASHRHPPTPPDPQDP